MTPPVDHVFHKFNGRLALFRSRPADKEHWEHRWAQDDLKTLLDVHRSGKLDEFENIFTHYLPKELPVLEAGCGKGQLVMALSARGYQVEGLDYAAATIQRIKAAAPELKVRVGDIYRLDASDGTYGGYISIGLFEHDPAGPRTALCETRRVLHPKGVALISVPYLNHKRARLLKYVTSVSGAKSTEGLDFYQYYFSREEFQGHVERAGMKVVACFPYGVHTGLVRDYPILHRLGRSRLFVWPLHLRFIRWCAHAPSWLRFKSAHMLMFVCQRTESH